MSEKRFYRVRNMLSLGVHFTSTIAVAAVSFALGPAWVMGASAAIIGGGTYFAYNRAKRFVEDSLNKHPEKHKFSPNLGRIAKELYKEAGVKSETYPIYNFSFDAEKLGLPSNDNEKLTRFAALKYKFNPKARLKKIADFIATTHNAAAVPLNNPVIIISEPMLRLLNSEEEKAVLAHEFAHIKSQHSRVGSVQGLLASASQITNKFAVILTALATGWMGIAYAVAAVLGANIVLSKSSKILRSKEKDLDLKQLVKRKKFLNRKSTAVNLIGVGAISYFNPIFLPVWIIAKTLSFSTGLISKSFSRSNEYQADRGAVELGADPLALITGFRKIEIIKERSTKLIYKEDIPKAGVLTKAWNNAHATHPTIDRRIERMAKLAREQGVSEDKIKTAVSGEVKVPATNNISEKQLRRQLGSKDF